MSRDFKVISALIDGGWGGVAYTRTNLLIIFTKAMAMA